MSIDTWRGWKPRESKPRPPQPEPTTEFGALLRSLRHRRGISQSKLAELAEFDHSHVSRLEAGTRMPTKEAVERLAFALSLPDGERDDWRRSKLYGRPTADLARDAPEGEMPHIVAKSDTSEG